MLALVASASAVTLLAATPAAALGTSLPGKTPVPVATVTPSGALSTVIPAGTWLDVENSQGSTKMFPVGDEMSVAVGDAGEKRLVTLTIPTTLEKTRGPVDRAMLIWSVRCHPIEDTHDGIIGGVRQPKAGDVTSTGTVVSGSPVNGKNLTRNVLLGETHTAVVRTLVEFSSPGHYTCRGEWGARSRFAVGGEKVKVVGTSTLEATAPVADPENAVNCYWPATKEFVGGHPEDCYYSAAPEPGSAAERAVPGGAALRINKVRTTVAKPSDTAPGRWMLAQAHLAVTTCAGSQQSTSPCTTADLGGGSLVEGTIVLRDQDDQPYPAACVEVDRTLDGTKRLDVSSAVHHDAVLVELRFRIKPRPTSTSTSMCEHRNLRLTSHVAVLSGKAAWAEHSASQLSVLVEP
ncbi:hypothetical protein Cfla_0970 [Cellulomonas flavigena DSM 20109]|uniref:Uncharacterized protein n=1 Tax=Cellulomonas flavigena (strain ATCC 482 / DSM 20109 / BCRC 11376 / JCM 18109 / NBRC 3775 / NCIMB 8073 / NRS 134) TaxID=446466 RepID=D5UKQ8_CELFN|nr:hypothetical protein Cfla_0970 [Cellulomonas flavigena DSM 20109]